MTSSNPPKPEPPPELTTGLERLRVRVDLARATEGASGVLVQDLEAAYEELRVAYAELRAQHESIERLVESHQSLRLQQERTMAILPVPIVVTDMRGVVRSVNTTAASLVGARVSRVVGRPFFNLFATSDRRDLRHLISEQGRESMVVRRAATLLSQTGDPLAVEVTASVQFPGAGENEVSWILLAGRDRATEGLVSITRSLTEMALLPRHGMNRPDVLESAVGICGEALRGRAEVTAALGSPVAPEQVASSSQVAQAWDAPQVATGEGPSEIAFREGVTVSSLAPRADLRWPRLAARLPAGAPAVVAAAIRPGDEVVGTLTAYVSDHRAGLSEMEELVELFAVTLGGVLHELDLVEELDRLEDDLRRALSSRAVIDQAKGIIMASRGIGPDEAWKHLVDLSSTQHRKLRDVAADTVRRASVDSRDDPARPGGVADSETSQKAPPH